MTFDGNAVAQACREAAQNWSDAAAFWAIGNPTPAGTLQTVCALQAPDATATVLVEGSEVPLPARHLLDSRAQRLDSGCRRDRCRPRQKGG